jgi:hypothetical protein
MNTICMMYDTMFVLVALLSLFFWYILEPLVKGLLFIQYLRVY